MIAYSHSASHYDNHGQRRYVYGSPRPAAEREEDPPPLAFVPAQLDPMPFTLSADGKCIVFDMHYRKGVTALVESAGRRIDLSHPLALAGKVRADNGHVRALVRVVCPCGFTRHLEAHEWSRGRGCQKCARKRLGRELTGVFARDDSNVIPLFVPFGRRR
jgi:hypothetical protein